MEKTHGNGNERNLTNKDETKMSKSTRWKNKDFRRIYNSNVKSRCRNPQKWKGINILQFSKDEYNEFLRQQEEQTSKIHNEQVNKRKELEEERKRQSPLEFGREPILSPNTQPSIRIIDNFTVIDYSYLKKKKPESNIWQF